MNTESQKEHEWLQKFVGEWTFEAEATMKPGELPMKSSGTETVRSLGGFWIVAEAHGEMPEGGSATSITTLGYDPKKMRYVGSWVGSMMADFWLYNGRLDPAERVLTLDSEGPSMNDETKVAKYQDIVEFKSDEHRVLTAQIQGDDGQWHAFMTTNYRRKK